MTYLNREDFKNHLASRHAKSKAGKINNDCNCPLAQYIKTDKDVGLVSVGYKEIVVGSNRGEEHDKSFKTPKWAFDFIEAIDGKLGGTPETNTTVSYGRCLKVLESI